ncbi:unnamed protein product [Prunus brigantina]
MSHSMKLGRDVDSCCKNVLIMALLIGCRYNSFMKDLQLQTNELLTLHVEKAGFIKSTPTLRLLLKFQALRKKLETLMRAVIPPSPQQVCTICSDPTHSMELHPSTTQGSKQVLQVNSFQRPRNDPYSNTYNSGEPKKPALEDLIAQFVQTSQQN